MVIKNISKDNLCMFSYNTRGFGVEKQMHCKYLLENTASDQIPILCNQEHFLMKANCRNITNALPGFHAIIKPAIKGDYVCGRAKGGLFIAFPDSLKNLILDVSPDNWRIQAVILKCENESLMIINSYFPTDERQLYDCKN